MRPLDQIEWVLHTGKIGLGRKGEEIGAVGIRLIEQCLEPLLIDAQIGNGDGRVFDAGASNARELPDAVDRVVIVEGQQAPAADGNRPG